MSFYLNIVCKNILCGVGLTLLSLSAFHIIWRNVLFRKFYWKVQNSIVFMLTIFCPK